MKRVFQKLKKVIFNMRNVLFSKYDIHMQEVLNGMFIAFLMKGIGASLMFLFNVVIARLLGVEDSGLYFLAFAIVAIGSVIARLGLDNALLKFIASYVATNERVKVSAVYTLGMRMAILSSVLTTAIIFSAAPWIAEFLFNKPALAEPLRWMSLSILPFALLNLQAESLKGLKCFFDALFIQGVALPLLALISIYTWASSDIMGLVWSYVWASIIVALLGMWRWRVNRPQSKNVIEKFPVKILWESCKPLLIVSVINRGLMPWAPILLLGIWASTNDVGIFGVTTRVVLMVSFFLVAINNIVAPKFAELYAKGDMEALGEVARRSVILVSVMVSPVFIVLFFYGEWVLSLFGVEFIQGANILAILSLGQLVNVLCGSVGYLLMMSGNEKVYRNITISTAILQLILMFMLVPIFGGLGAAIAASVALASMNIAAVWMVHRKLGIMTLPMFGR